jgi:hypothetical protein
VNSQVQYRIHNIHTPEHAFCHFNPVRTLAPYSIKRDFNICASVSQMDSSLYAFRLTFWILLSSPTHTPPPPNRIHLGLFNLIMFRAKSMNYEGHYYANFFLLLLSCLLSPKYSSRHFLPETPNTCCVLKNRPMRQLEWKMVIIIS